MTTTGTTQQALTTSELVALLDEAGLDGRGGAGFSAARKIESAIGRDVALIVNGCDGEIGAAKDAWVLTAHLPQVRHAAALIGARRVRFAVHRDTPVERSLRAAGVEVLAIPDRYVASEASALVAFAAGGPAKPITKRTHLVHGAVDVNGRRLPTTLVLNAETMLRIAQIVDRGPDWFRSQGTIDEPGPRLVTITGAVPRPGVYETAAGVLLGDVLALAGVTDPGPVHAGGLAGGWIAADAVATTPWSRAALRAVGADIGAATLTVLAPDECPVDYAARLVDFAAGESAGQCGPCMFGLPAVAADFRALAAGRRGAAAQLDRRVPLLAGRGACHYPDGVGVFVTSTRTVFAEHLARHAEGACELRHPATKLTRGA